MTEAQMCLDAISKNELCYFLTGEKNYKLINREIPLQTDYSRVLVNGIYKAFKEDSIVEKEYNKALFNMINSNKMDNIVICFNYIRLQYQMEKTGFASFSVDKNIVKLLNEFIKGNKEPLSDYKSINEFGSYLENGAYQFICNMEKIMERDYNVKIIDVDK